MFCSKLIIAVLFLASTRIVNNKCNEIHQTFPRKEMQKKFIQTVNSIPTLEKNFNKSNDIDIVIMMNMPELGMNGTKPEFRRYLRKLLSLGCTYGHVTLYVLYHLIDIQSNGQSIEDTLLDYYRECMHHMLQVLYLADSLVDREMWYVAITLDALVRHKLDWRSINFKRMADSLIGSLTQRCVPDQLLENIPVYERLSSQFDFVSYKQQLGSQLRLSQGHQLFMADLYYGDDQFEIYQFIWDKNRDYTNFTPPDSWFKSYDDKRMRKAYEEVVRNWKSDFYSIQKYMDSVQSLVLTVTYYALLLHCHYIQKTWYFVFVQDKSVSLPNEQGPMQNEAIALLQIPLSLVDDILQNVNISEDMEYLKDINSNLTNYENADRTAFNKFVDRLLDRYNFYASQFDLEHMEYSAMKVKFSVPNHINVITLNTTLLEFTEILDSYYDTVKRTLSPTNFHVIQYFMLTKPSSVNCETPQDPILSLKNKISTEYEQDLEKRKYFLRVLNKIPTLDKSPLWITDSELNAMTDIANEKEPTKFITPESYERKIRALNCSYGNATLYMLYHINDLYNNDRSDDEKTFYLHRYTKCAHRLMSVLNASKSFIFRATWLAMINMDAFRHNKIEKNDDTMSKTMSCIMNSIKRCHKYIFMSKIFLTYDDLIEKGPFDFVAYNDKLLSKLMLSDGNEGFMMNLYRGDERFDIYQFFWNNNRDYKSFQPPARWFPVYNDKHLQTVYEDVAFNWKISFYIIIRYKEAIFNLVMMVTYYALLLHFHYLKTMWSTVTRQVKSDDLTTWIRIPLPLVNAIFRDLSIPEDSTNIFGEIENNLSNSDKPDWTAFNDSINCLFERYNSYATHLDLKEIEYSMMAKKFLAPDRLEFSDLKTKLLEIFEILNDYYKTVRQTLSPTTFYIINCFTSSKPEFLKFETSPDPNQQRSTVSFKHCNSTKKKQMSVLR